MNKINAIGNFIEKCPCVYDVGSDHAHLAIFLLRNKLAKHVVNVEIKTQPLTNGIINLNKQHLIKQTSNIINDGLTNISKKTKKKPSYIVIAGMGGNNIIKILENKDKKLPKCYYLLQANSEFVLLRKWLVKNKWTFIKELTVYDHNHYYQIMLVKQSNKTTRLNPLSLYFGLANKQKDKKTYKQHIAFIKKKIETKKLHKFSKEFKQLYLAIKEQ